MEAILHGFNAVNREDSDDNTSTLYLQAMLYFQGVTTYTNHPPGREGNNHSSQYVRCTEIECDSIS